MYRTSTTRWPETIRRTLCAAALLAIVACSRGDAGPPRTEQRGVDAFHSIELRGAIDATVQAGDRISVTLVATADALQATSTNVHNGMLVIDAESGEHWLRGNRKIQARITLPTLNSLSMKGAGKTVITGIESSALALVLQGAGSISASGHSATLNARVNGAGTMDLANFASGDASVLVNGAGKLDVNVSGSLEATLNGVGSITYAGKPRQVESHLNGVGRIVAAAQPGG